MTVGNFYLSYDAKEAWGNYNGNREGLRRSPTKEWIYGIYGNSSAIDLSCSFIGLLRSPYQYLLTLPHASSMSDNVRPCGLPFPGISSWWGYDCITASRFRLTTVKIPREGHNCITASRFRFTTVNILGGMIASPLRGLGLPS